MRRGAEHGEELYYLPVYRCTGLGSFVIFYKLTDRETAGRQGKLESLRHRVRLCLEWYWKP
jgi:hypothetical protein